MMVGRQEAAAMTLAGGLPAVEKPVTCRGSFRRPVVTAGRSWKMGRTGIWPTELIQR